MPLCLCASVPLCLCASVPLCLGASVPRCLCASVPLCLCAAAAEVVPAHLRAVHGPAGLRGRGVALLGGCEPRETNLGQDEGEAAHRKGEAFFRWHLFLSANGLLQLIQERSMPVRRADDYLLYLLECLRVVVNSSCGAAGAPIALSCGCQQCLLWQLSACLAAHAPVHCRLCLSASTLMTTVRGRRSGSRGDASRFTCEIISVGQCVDTSCVRMFAMVGCIFVSTCPCEDFFIFTVNIAI